MDISADNALFFSDLAEPIIVRQAGAEIKTVSGLYNAEYKPVLGMESIDPQVLLGADELLGLERKLLTLVIRGTEHRIKNSQPDGQGLTMHTLTRI